MSNQISTDVRLTARELECVRWIACGLRQEALADKLKVSVATVALHIVNARKKLGAQTTTHAVAIAVARGLIAL
jgi:DNA-binding CsgD family transcriptional regulator